MAVVHDTADAPGAHGHAHPHAPGDPSGRPRLGFAGPGRVGTALALAAHRAGWPVAGVCGRDPERLARFTRLVPGVTVVAHAAELLERADVVVLAVPDDAVAEVAAGLRLYGGQALVHTSGALPAAVLDVARSAGSLTGSFHPLVAVADPEQAVDDLRGATIALEGDAALLPILSELAVAVGAQPVRLPPGGKPAYHAAAVLAAGGLVGLLDGIAEVARGAGLDEASAMAVYVPLSRQALANAERLGIGAALTGPFVRGDAGTIRAHLDVLRRLAPTALPLYLAVAEREIALAERHGALDAGRAGELRRLLAESPDASGP